MSGKCDVQYFSQRTNRAALKTPQIDVGFTVGEQRLEQRWIGSNYDRLQFYFI
jgi:hypothetical protein